MLAALRSGRTSFSDIRDRAHAKQDAFVIDPQRFVAAQCFTARWQVHTA
jgi:hypothetical protein